MPLTYTTSYEATPWAAGLDKNEQTVYVPELMEAYTRLSSFYRLVDYAVDLMAQRTQKVVFTQRLNPPANIATLDNRALWLPQLYMDSRQIEITTARYGDKVQLDKFSDYVTYWQSSGGAGLQPLMRDILGPHMTASLDLLARNAFLASHFSTFAGGATGFDNLQADDVFDPSIARGLALRQAYQTDPTKNPLFCVTSPAAVYTVRSSTTEKEWLLRNQYANPSILINGEIGTYENCRYAQSPFLTLWNCGTIVKQSTIDASIAIGDGAADPATTLVDGVWKVGQAGKTHYITVSSSTTFAVGDLVTLHRERNGSQDKTHVLNGVKWDSATNLERRIVAIETGKLIFDEPVTVDWFVDAISPGLYGYVTKARPIHVALFIWGPRAVVAGVTQPPQTYTPRPIDDTEFIWRFSWDAYIKFQPFMTHHFLVHYFAGPVDVNGVVTNI